MRRIFLPGRIGDRVTLAGDEARHIGYSLRARAGERFVAVGEGGEAALMEIDGFTKGTVSLRTVKRLAEDDSPRTRISIAACILKGGKTDLVVQKAVELGADEVQPLTSENCVARYDGKKADERRSRWQRIADEAAKQCAASSLTRVLPIKSLSEWLGAAGRFSRKAFMCYEGERERTIFEALTSEPPNECVAIVGPEGGFSEQETEAARAAGAVTVSLGPRILRAETAAIAALTIMQYELGDMGGRGGA